MSCGVSEQLNVNMVSIFHLVCLQLSTVAPQLLTQINIRVDVKQPQLRERDVESSCLGLPQSPRGLLYVYSLHLRPLPVCMIDEELQGHLAIRGKIEVC